MHRRVTIDAETYYDREYSLSNLTTQQYLLDPQFETIGGSISVDGSFPVWHVGNRFAEELQQMELDRPGTVLCAHNAMFDGGILEYVYGIKPWRYLCTMMGARPNLIHKTPNASMALAALAPLTNVGPKGTEVVKALGKRLHAFTTQELCAYGDYCIRDTEICDALAQEILQHLPEQELDLIDMTIKKFTRPQLVLDRATLILYLASVKALKRKVLVDAGIEDAAELRSNIKFAELLKLEGVIPPTKPSLSDPTQRIYAFAKTDRAFKDLMQDGSDRVQALCAARLQHRTTMAEKRTERFLETARLGGKFGAPLLYYGAHTGRYSGLDKLNLQNPNRGGELRRAICAPKGHSIVAGDLAQIEARVLAWLAGQKDLLAVFRDERDPYKDFATKLYAVGYDEVTPMQRRICKSAILGLGYGMGPTRFGEYLDTQNITDLSQAQVKVTVYSYRETYSKVKDLWERASLHWLPTLMGKGARGKFLRYGPLFITEGFIGLPNGMTLRYPDLREIKGELTYGPPKRRRYIYGAKVVENVVQALARIIMTNAEHWLFKRGVPDALSVHDELLFVVPDAYARKMGRVLSHALTREVPWAPDLPLACEIKIGPNYGRLEEVQL